MPDAGCQMPDAGCRMPDAGCRMPDARCQMPDARFSITDKGELRGNSEVRESGNITQNLYSVYP